MSNYIVDEAQESEEEDVEYNEDERKRLKKLRRVQSDSSEEEDEEEDEEKIAEEAKGFINDDDEEGEEEAGSGSDSEVEGKRKRDDDDDLDDDNLDEDDIDLIEENIGVKIDRKKKFKRLKRIEDEDSDAEEGDDRTKIANEIFQGSGDEEEVVEDTSSQARQPQVEEYGSEDEGEDSDGGGSFIVDDDGRPLQKTKKKPVFADEGLEAARDIFGCDFDYGEFEQYEQDWEERDDEEDDDDYEDDEDMDREVVRRTKEKKKVAKKSIYEVFEPSDLERGHLTSQDHEIRKTDVPERFQLRQIPVTPTRAEGDERGADRVLEDEAKWIYYHAFYRPYISNQEGRDEARMRSKRDNLMIQKIYNSLDLMRNSTCEVPFIAFYRKEEVQPELNIHDLWKIYKFDERYCQLKGRKNNFVALYRKMVEYQMAMIMKKPDDPIPEDFRGIKEEDISRIEEIESSEQFNDFYKHFLLYYGKDQELMREFYKAKNKEKTVRTVTRTVKVMRKVKRKKKKKANIGDEDNTSDAEGEGKDKENERERKDKKNKEEGKDKDVEEGNDIKNEGKGKDKENEEEGNDKEDVEEGKDTENEEEKKDKENEGEGKDKEKEGEKSVNGVKEDEEEEEEEVETEVETEVEEEVEEENEMEVDPDTLKKAIRRHEYELLRRAGIEGFAKKFGLTPEQFGENLRDSYQRYEVEQFPEDPLVDAENYTSKMCSTPERVLEAAIRMVGWQLACEPLIRKNMREAYFEKARISVRPTPKGNKTIDEHHSLYPIKYLFNKPVVDLQGDQFLRIKAGVEEKAITFSLSETIEGITTTNYLDEMKQLYYRDEFSSAVLDWNKLRGRAVEFAYARIIADLKRELTQRLLLESKDHVLEMCCRKLYNWLKIAPYNPGDFSDEEEDEWDTSKGFRVFAISFLPDLTQAAFGMCIDVDGDCSENSYIRLPALLKRRNAYNERDAREKEEDLKRLGDYIKKHKPHVVVVGSESRDALMVLADLKDILKELEEHDQFPKINVELINNELAKIYSYSKKGQSDFRDYPPLLREAISLGRLVQDPLTEFSQLCNTDDEILNLNYHPLQAQLSPPELLEALHTEFVNRTNEVGVDLNMAVAYSHTQNLVQFICGLGPRKGHNLIKAMKHSNSRLENRNQLVVNYHMGPKVFINCAGFIRIDTNALGDSDNYIEVLDSTRIHPEAYDWARKMAVDALEYDDEEGKPAEALEEILETPERLSELDLEAFAIELNNQGFGKKNVTLNDIRHELNHRYKDFRIPFRSPTPEEIFNMLTKETPETFYIGKLIQVVVIDFIHRKPRGEQLDNANPVRNEETGLWQCPFCLKNDFPELSEVWNHFDAEDCPGQAIGVKVRLDNGISGFIHIKNLSDKTVTNPAERVRRHGLIHCRITKIDPEKFSVELSSKTSDLQDVDSKWKQPKDVFYDYDTENRDSSSEKKKTEKKKTQYHKRVIAHPSFRNIDYNEAEKLMQTLEQGDALIRPSSKGVDHLTVTWKVLNGVCQHIDVREQDKRNDFSLGQKLWIGTEEFEDLDEILARHVAPMSANVRQILDYKNYNPSLSGNKEKVVEFLKEAKKLNVKNIPYVFSSVPILPGKFMLSYLPRNKVIHEYVTVLPEGYKFRGKYHTTLPNLLKWFKSNFRTITRNIGAVTPGMMTNQTPYMGATPNLGGIDSSTIHKVAQNIPSHLLHSLSAAAASTPFGTPFSTYSNYANTPYTPSGQTPFMTPYNTPGPSFTPRYGGQTPTHTHQYSTPMPIVNNTTPAPAPTPAPVSGPSAGGNRAEMDWQKAAAAWAQAQGGRRAAPGGRTPRQDDIERLTPRYSNKYEDRSTARRYEDAATNKSHNYPYDGAHTTPRSIRSTPKTIHSPSNMSIGGDQTPLYDE